MRADSGEYRAALERRLFTIGTIRTTQRSMIAGRCNISQKTHQLTRYFHVHFTFSLEDFDYFRILVLSLRDVVETALGVLPEIAQLQSLSDSHERKEKAMRLKICILAVYVLAMSTSSFGDVLVSNFFDDNSSDRGSIDTGLTQYEINCIDGHRQMEVVSGGNQPCDLDEDLCRGCYQSVAKVRSRTATAMRFTVGGEYASAFSGVQIELDSEDSFSKVKVRLDKGETRRCAELGAHARGKTGRTDRNSNASVCRGCYEESLRSFPRNL